MARPFFACSALVLLVSSLAQAQNFSKAPCPDGEGGSGHSWFFGGGPRACELRRATLPVAGNRVGVDGQNGSIEVRGEDRQDIALEAKVTAQATSQEDVDKLLRDVRIVTDGTIHAVGPDMHGGGRSWSVSYRLRVPRRLATVALQTSNGSIAMASLASDVQARTSNGSLSLEDLGGTVHAETTNGGVQVGLAGGRWQGQGLFVRTTNGGITVKVPSNFAAHLVADTTNGGISVAFPLPDSEERHRTHVEADLNGGGPPVQLKTTNGGVSVNRL